MCCKGDGVISDSVLLPFFSGTQACFTSVPLLSCSGLQMGMGGWFRFALRGGVRCTPLY